MKKLFTILAASLLLAACEKSPLKQLPPATQEGKNTIGALINGKVYNTYHDNSNRNNITCSNTCEFNEGGLNGQYIRSGMCKHNGYYDIHIYIYDGLEEGKTYIFREPTFGFATAKVSAKFNTFETNANSTGSLTITKLTPTVISGTFHFTAKANPDISQDTAATITVTDGRFDISR